MFLILASVLFNLLLHVIRVHPMPDIYTLTEFCSSALIYMQNTCILNFFINKPKFIMKWNKTGAKPCAKHLWPIALSFGQVQFCRTHYTYLVNMVETCRCVCVCVCVFTLTKLQVTILVSYADFQHDYQCGAQIIISFVSWLIM